MFAFTTRQRGVQHLRADERPCGLHELFPCRRRFWVIVRKGAVELIIVLLTTAGARRGRWCSMFVGWATQIPGQMLTVRALVRVTLLRMKATVGEAHAESLGVLPTSGGVVPVGLGEAQGNVLSNERQVVCSDCVLARQTCKEWKHGSMQAGVLWTLMVRLSTHVRTYA